MTTKYEPTLPEILDALQALMKLRIRSMLTDSIQPTISFSRNLFFDSTEAGSTTKKSYGAMLLSQQDDRSRRAFGARMVHFGNLFNYLAERVVKQIVWISMPESQIKTLFRLAEQDMQLLRDTIDLGRWKDSEDAFLDLYRLLELFTPMVKSVELYEESHIKFCGIPVITSRDDLIHYRDVDGYERHIRSFRGLNDDSVETEFFHHFSMSESHQNFFFFLYIFDAFMWFSDIRVTRFLPPLQPVRKVIQRCVDHKTFDFPFLVFCYNNRLDTETVKSIEHNYRSLHRTLLNTYNVSIPREDQLTLVMNVMGLMPGQREMEEALGSEKRFPVDEKDVTRAILMDYEKNLEVVKEFLKSQYEDKLQKAREAEKAEEEVIRLAMLKEQELSIRQMSEQKINEMIEDPSKIPEGMEIGFVRGKPILRSKAPSESSGESQP